MKAAEWRKIVERKAYRDRFSEWNSLCAEYGNAKRKHEGTKGQWQKQATSLKVLEQIKRHVDMDCDAHMMRRAYYAERSGNWEGFNDEFRKRSKFSE